MSQPPPSDQPYPQGGGQPYPPQGGYQPPPGSYQPPNPYPGSYQPQDNPQPGYQAPPVYQQPPAYQPAYSPQAGPAGGSPSPARRSLWLAALAGFVVAAIIAVILAVTGVLPSKKDSTSVDTSAISLPTKVGTYEEYAVAAQHKGAPAKSVTYTRTADSKTATALSAAYGGAGAAVETYSDSSLQSIFSLWVVRADSPAPVVGYQGAQYIGLAQPPIETKRFGDVTCVLQTTVQTPAGQKPPAHSQIATQCQRTGSGLTVQFRSGGESPLATDPPRAAALVDQIWNQLS